MEWSHLQTAIYQKVSTSKKNLIVQAVAGSGKCLGKGTLVMMANGTTKPVEDIMVGEYVMGMNSQPRCVLSTTSGISDLFKIIPNKGEPWICNGDHILTLVKSRGRNASHDGKVYDISLKDFLAGSSTSKFHKTDKRISSKLFREPISFPCQKPEFDPYIIGLWLGDGTFNAAQITTTDQPIIDACLEKEQELGCEVVVTERKNYFYIRFRVGILGNTGRHTPHLFQRYLFSQCRKGGGETNRNYRGDKTIPVNLLRNSREVRLELLAGLIDTDGYVNVDKVHAEITTKFPSLRDDILYLCRSLGFAAYPKEKLVKLKNGMFKKYYRISISGDLTQIPVRLERKKVLSRKGRKNVLRTGFKVEPHGTGEYFGFTLDGDGRFLLGDFTVTHNSTTLFEIARRAGTKVLFLAFNKDIAEYAGKKMGQAADCRTFHSYGNQTIKAFTGVYPKIDQQKVWKFISSNYNRRDYRGEWYPGSIMNKVIKKIRTLGMMSYEEDDVRGFLEEHPELWNRKPKTAQQEKAWVFSNIRQIPNLLRTLDNDFKKIDFDDMVRLPCIHNMTRKLRWLPGTVLVDEAQDMNPYQIHLIMQLRKRGVRTICVGDSNQAIYAFRGSFANSLDLLKEMTDADELPLSVTYRCKEEIVEHVNLAIAGSNMEAFNPGGSVTRIQKDGIVQYIIDNNIEMMIGARNKSLVELWIMLAKKRIGSSLKGTGTSEELFRIIDDHKPENLADLLSKVENTLHDAYVYNDEKGEEVCILAEKTVELMRCIRILVEEFEITTLKGLDDMIADMEKDSNRVLHTVHSSKGLEDKNVIVLEDWFPNDQLENMRYVAMTRGSDNLTLVEDWGKEERVDEEI